MRHFLIAATVALLTACGGGGSGPSPAPTPAPTKTSQITAYAPQAVAKTKPQKVYVHLLPWFETPATSGQWGIHWAMAKQAPSGIASFYYPLIGPYASSDLDVIEYQLLLMKLSGIDGVLIDWYGTQAVADYPSNLRNTEAITSLVGKVGLEYAIVYEDHVLQGSPDAVATAKADLGYALARYFTAPEYIKVDGQPLLLAFGPQSLTRTSDWQDVLSSLATVPKFLTLWYSPVAGDGEFSWVYQDAGTNDHLDHLGNFYAKPGNGLKMGSAYPGMRDFYTEGGWSDNVAFAIDHKGTQTFAVTLDMALANTGIVQLITWNDYGEGSMIEPTREFGYSFLVTLQQKLGVPYSQPDLELVAKLYELRKSHPGDLRLDQAFYLLASLHLDAARALLESI